jgi:hypothetical protein
MKKVLICLGVSAILFSFLGVAEANLITDGDFETVDGRTGIIRGLALDSLGPGATWDVYSALPDGAGGTSWYGSNAGIEVQRNTVVIAHSGSHYVELDSHDGLGSTNSSMSQDITFDKSGVYDLSFWYYPRSTAENDNIIDVFFGGSFLAAVNGVNTPTTDWELFTFCLGDILAGTTQTLTFTASGLDNRLGGFLDDISVDAAPVPEPATMLLLGTGLVGLAGFRRKFKK